MLFQMLLPLAALAFITASTATTTPSPDLQIQTTSGLVNGIYNDTAQTVRTFLGIPYAEAPVGLLRFAPPVAKAPLPATDPIDGSTFSGPCPQVYSYDNESIWSTLPYKIWNPAQMTENCLAVNIWAPARKDSVQGDEKSPVLLFIHGGGFGEGAGSVGFYDGSNLVRDQGDVVVVTFNYRLNIFGFPNAPGLDVAEQNVGLLDQRLAVEWVHRNIANFGGDPDRILLFGQSAGAASVDAYSYAYPENPLVSALALESGTGTIIQNTDHAHQSWNNLSNATGCGSGEQSLDCMREVPWQDVIDELANGSPSRNFAPVADNKTFFFNPADQAGRGELARLPTMGGITAQEFSASISLSRPSANETDIMEDVYNRFSCPLSDALGLRIQQDIPTWRYVYHGNFPNLSPTTWIGAYHTSEIPMIFGTYNMTTLPSPSTPNEVEASRYIQGAWVAFARDPENGLIEYGWPQFSPGGK
ncbi:Alpha/Beta hydrolase protein [Aspergillus undulatus]|uniref:Alpha/Beta hydrolase protein n=1 Tax=Aspergillus undulatus TaxID=1810928 RepID=UPI003CCDB2E5